MADVLYFESMPAELFASGGTGIFSFNYDPSVIRAPQSLTATTDASWVALSLNVNAKALTYTVAENYSSQRTAVITLSGPAFYPGQSQPRPATTTTTILQHSLTAGTGSITVAESSVLLPSVGGSSAMTYTLNNIATDGSLFVYSDSSWLEILEYDRSGFTYNCSRNTGDGTRNATVRVSGHIQGSPDYAEAYITFTQPAMEDRGYITFAEQMVIASGSSAYTAEFTCSHIAHLDTCIPSEAWVTITASGYTGTSGSISFSVAENPYRSRRNCTITLKATSSSDGSEIRGTLTVNQLAGTGDLPVGSVSFQPSTVTAPSDEPYSGGTQYYPVNMVNTSITITSYDGNFDPEHPPVIVSTDACVVEWHMLAPTEENGFTQSYINIGGTDIAGNVITNAAQLVILQPPFVKQLEFPIWQDTDVLITSSEGDDHVDYTITISGLTKYQGRAYTLGDKCVVRLNEIMETFLIPELDLNSYGIQDNNAYINGYLNIGLGESTFEPFRKVKCFADWSYERHNLKFLSDPISKTVDYRQRFLCSVIDYSDMQPTVILETFNGMGGTSTQLYTLTNQIGTIVSDPWSDETITVSIGNRKMTYTVDHKGCKRYCLYYLNAYGGWDSYVFNKTSKESDDFKRDTYNRRINNQNIVHGKVEYKNQITKKWTLKTDYLNDTQSIILAKHMMSSPCAYLHDFETDEIFPVLVTNKTTDYKTFERNGRKFNRYDVTVELAQNRKRR